MNDLIEKYKKDQLAANELLQLRAEVNSMTDEAIEQQLSAVWMDKDIDTTPADDERIARMKERIDTVIGRKTTIGSKVIRWSQIAAAILLPVFILTTLYYYRENSLVLSDETLVTTGKAERASITLPDGSIVSLNTESRLGYLPKSYNKKERQVNFSGEGYFQVSQNKEVPFLIQSKGLQVKVLGTVFNLSVRETSRSAELALEEGSVWLASTTSKQSVTLRENQKAVVDYLTGRITVTTDEYVKDASAWRRGDMVFRRTPLSQVIRTIEDNYNVTITIDFKERSTDPFTGTLPVNNLNEVLEVLEQSYHLKTTIDGKEVVLKAR